VDGCDAKVRDGLSIFHNLFHFFFVVVLFFVFLLLLLLGLERQLLNQGLPLGVHLWRRLAARTG